MGEIIAVIIEIIIELFFFGTFEERSKSRKIRRKIKRLKREHQWFDEFYKNEKFANIINHDMTVNGLLLNKKYVKELTFNESEKQRFIQVVEKIDLLSNENKFIK